MLRSTIFVLASLFLSVAHAESEGIADAIIRDPLIQGLYSGFNKKYRCERLDRTDVTLKCSKDAPYCEFRIWFNCEIGSDTGVTVVTEGSATEVDDIALTSTEYNYFVED